MAEQVTEGTTKVHYTVLIAQDDWVKMMGRRIGEKPSFVIRELLRQAQALGWTPSKNFGDLTQQAS